MFERIKTMISPTVYACFAFILRAVATILVTTALIIGGLSLIQSAGAKAPPEYVQLAAQYPSGNINVSDRTQ